MPRSSHFKPRSCRLSLLCVCLVLSNHLGAPSHAGPVPVWTSPLPTFPNWWFERDVIPRLNPANTAPVWPSDYKQSDDFAVANIGQAKRIAAKARDEFNAVLSARAGAAIDSMVDPWSQEPHPGSAPRDDFAGISVGQLKALAKPFHDRLIRSRYVTTYPWTPIGTDDNSYALANIGQLKKVFSFNLTKDSDGDGLPDMWETAAIGSLAMTAAGHQDNDGITNGQEFALGTNAAAADSDGDGVRDDAEVAANTDPNDFYNGIEPEAPENVRADRIDGNRVSVTWTNVAQGITEFTIERTNDGLNWSVIGRVSGTAREFIDPAPQPGKIHFYGITATR